MKYTNTASLLFLFFVSITSCKNSDAQSKNAIENIIPKPVSVTSGNGAFSLTRETGIYLESETPQLIEVAKFFTYKLMPSTGFVLSVASAKGEYKPGNIYLSIANDPTLGDEGYDLNVSQEFIKVKANKPAGIFYAMQTIRQLLPPKIELSTAQQGPWEIPAVIIRDYPVYTFRSSMLDVARHFFTVDDVKRYIDLISFYKMNALHLHLSDDQGWRIEIKAWPNLTEHGGSTEVGGGNGGFYTQEQYKDIVRYAMEKFVTIIPEIDMPGHTNAVLASYAELNCNDSATKLYTGTDVGFSTLCTHKDVTYKFVDDVIGELSSITPGPWIHIGGDESHATKKEDYIPFENKVQQIVKAHGKQVIGWDEIALSTLQPNTIAQYWADADNSQKAVKQGAKIIMSPATKTYLDMKYDPTTKLGQNWAAYIEVNSAYDWEPTTMVKGIAKENILGIEAPLWTETITNMNEIEYMVFPRLLGYAEIGWSPATGRNWNEYKLRLANQASRLNAMDIDFYKSKLVPWK